MPTLVHTADGKYVLAAAGVHVKLFSCETGALVRLLSGHSAAVTAVDRADDNVLQAVSASLDGCIVVWGLDDAVALRRFCVGRPVAALSIAASTAYFVTAAAGDAPLPELPPYARALPVAAERVYAAPLRQTEKSARGAAAFVARAGGGARATDADAPLGSAARPWPLRPKEVGRFARGGGGGGGSSGGGKKKELTSLAVGDCGWDAPVVLASRGPALLVHDSRTGLSAQATHRRPVTCAAVSPTEPIAAAGDDVGRILLWYLQPAADAAADADDEGGGGDGGPSGALNVFPLRQMHWHAQRVGALSFSIDGAYLLSGGREAVLVSWQLHTAERSFVPRLAAPISAVAAAPDGGSVALLSHDNAVRLVDVAARRVRRTVHGLLPAARLAADGRLRCLLVYGGAAGGRVQWWAPRRHQQLLALEVAPTALSGSLPAVSSQRDPQRRAYRATALEGGAAVVHVTRAALSSDGSHLASLESRADAELAQTLTLKFWTLADGRWLECARVDRPHSAEATALAFHPHVMLVVTTGRDARFKLWEGSKPPPPRARGAAGAAAAAAGGAADALGSGGRARGVGVPLGGRLHDERRHRRRLLAERDDARDLARPRPRDAVGAVGAPPHPHAAPAAPHHRRFAALATLHRR